MLLGFLSRETRAQLGSCMRCSGMGEEGQKLAVSKHNYGRSDRPVQYSIDRFTLATWSPALPEAPLPHSVSLVLKAHLPPLPARVLDPREGQGPVFLLGPEQKTWGGTHNSLCSRDLLLPAPAPHLWSQEHHNKALAYQPLGLQSWTPEPSSFLGVRHRNPKAAGLGAPLRALEGLGGGLRHRYPGF